MKAIGYVVYDEDGDLIRDEYGAVRLLSSRKEAEQYKTTYEHVISPVTRENYVEMGSATMTTHLVSRPDPPKPPEELTRLERMYLEVVAQAEKTVNHRDPAAPKDRKDAQLAFEALREIELRRTSLRTMTAAIVAEVGRRQLWKYHPGSFSDLKSFLKAAGMKAYGHFYELVALGDRVVPFLEAGGIDIAPYISNSQCAKTMEAISHIRRQIDEGADTDQIQEILDDIQAMPGRDAVREKYRQSRTSPVGKGSYHGLDNGGGLAVVKFDDFNDIDVIMRGLSGKVEWQGLTMSVDERPRSVRVVISGR